jgi:carbamoylphosphate synthase large subunit
MRIVINDEEVEKAVVSLLKHIPGNKILIDHFLDRCQEAEVDAIYDGEEIHVMGVMEHIEPAGIHSGDSSCHVACLQPDAAGCNHHGTLCLKNCKSIKYQRTD